MLHHQVVAPGTDSKDSCSCNFCHSCNVSFSHNASFSYNVTVMPLLYRCVTNFLSTTVNYYTDILNVFKCHLLNVGYLQIR